MRTLDPDGGSRSARRGRCRARHPHEQFHRRAGHSPRAAGLDCRRALARPIRGSGPARAPAARQYLSRARHQSPRARRPQMADRLRERKRQRPAGRGVRRYGHHRVGALRARDWNARTDPGRRLSDAAQDRPLALQGARRDVARRRRFARLSRALCRPVLKQHRRGATAARQAAAKRTGAQTGAAAAPAPELVQQKSS